MTPIYLNAGLAVGATNGAAVQALQRDLRALGYLRRGIDGGFGDGTKAAVRALQFDLQFNRGVGSDGNAPVAVADYNKGRATSITGSVDPGTAACIGDMLDDAAFPKLPSAADPAAENAKALAAIAAAPSAKAPTPFLLAMIKQESGGQHYYVPTARDADNFVVTGLDRSGSIDDQITSRGHGIGQYTIFHHPPSQEEIADFILDPVRNVERAYEEFRQKWQGFVVGPADVADDRKAEHPLLPLRPCKYAQSDARYMRDCKACALAAGRVTIMEGTPVHAGATTTMQPTQYYKSAAYANVPNRADFGCDWPYAARRYNGSGVNSYHYQARILKNLAALA
ncbi:MAG: peptidoglycan-binding domain-containing protein [Propylenella sp.]